MTKLSRDEMTQKPEAQDAASSASARRRRLLTAGATSPLLMTIASRPAWANGAMCTPSALASANASGRHEIEGCSISAGWWKEKMERWPVDPRTPFHAVFPRVSYVPPQNGPAANQGDNGNNAIVLYDGMMLAEVIHLLGGSDPVQGTFALHLVGALLNALTFPPDAGGPGYAYTVDQILGMYAALDGASAAEFQELAATLEAANNQFDHVTDKPDAFF